MSSAYSWHTTPAAVVVKLGGGECTIFLHVVQIRQMLLLLTESENLLLLTATIFPVAMEEDHDAPITHPLKGTDWNCCAHIRSAVDAVTCGRRCTGSPDGRIATLSRPNLGPGLIETETADDFILSQQTSLTQATFTGLIPAGRASPG